MSFRRIGLALLLTPALACAAPVTIEWTGTIEPNNTQLNEPGLPASLTDLNVSGLISIDPAALPAPDAGNPAGVYSWSNGNFLSSSLSWQPGSFQPVLPGSTQSSSLVLDTTQDQCAITDIGSSVDNSGNALVGVFALQFAGYTNSILQLLSLGGAPIGGPTFGISLFGQTDTSSNQGFYAQVDVTSLKVESPTVAAPEVNTEGAATALTLFGFALAVARGRRRRLQAVRG